MLSIQPIARLANAVRVTFENNWKNDGGIIYFPLLGARYIWTKSAWDVTIEFLGFAMLVQSK